MCPDCYGINTGNNAAAVNQRHESALQCSIIDNLILIVCYQVTIAEITGRPSLKRLRYVTGLKLDTTSVPFVSKAERSEPFSATTVKCTTQHRKFAVSRAHRSAPNHLIQVAATLIAGRQRAPALSTSRASHKLRYPHDPLHFWITSQLERRRKSTTT